MYVKAKMILVKTVPGIGRVVEGKQCRGNSSEIFDTL
jgi:hypothetical protein